MMRPWLFVLVLAAAACGEPATTPRDISPEELLSSPPPEVVILDVRTPAEFAIGRVRREFLPAELGSAGVDTLRAVKRALDPDGLLNPGALLPE